MVCLDEYVRKLFTRIITLVTILAYIVLLFTVIWHDVDFDTALNNPAHSLFAITITLLGISACLLMTPTLYLKRYDLWTACIMTAYGSIFVLTVLLKTPFVMACAYALWILSILTSWCFCHVSPAEHEAADPENFEAVPLEEHLTPLTPVRLSKWSRD